MPHMKRMHPRNKYRNPPNFRQLAVEFEEFREFAIQDLSGKVSVDFKNASALRALTRVLLKKDWNLDVLIPPDRLIPTLPLRLNYILWLEDVLMSTGKDIIKTSVHGIDVGTGAACVYPLLAARKNKWHMLATEVDEESVKHAIANVKNNNLEDLIQVQQVSGDTILQEAVEKCAVKDGLERIVYDFCMCNPPFFASEDEMESSSKGRSPVRPRNPPRNARTGTMREVIFEGGEVAFVKKMIEEGKQLQDRILILSTMLGHKSSLPKVTKILVDAGIKNIVQSEFCQGRTTRWGMAWSHSIDLTSSQAAAAEVASENAKQEKPRPPQQYVVPENCGKTLEDVASRIIQILDSISVRYNLLEKKPHIVTYKVTAYENTWSNQRRKRREEKRHQEKKEPGNEEHPVTSQASSMTDSSAERTEGTQKRSLDPPSEDSSAKRVKVEESTPLLVMTLVVRNLKGENDEESSEDTKILIGVSWVEGTGGREMSNQVLQFLKNNLRPKVT